MNDHPLKAPVQNAINQALDTDSDLSAEAITEQVMRALDERGVIQYAPKGTLPLLSAAGRVFVCIAENPRITLREISVMLGVTESNVARSVSKLVASGVIARTKVKNRNVYTIKIKTAKKHPDIHRFYEAIDPLWLEDGENAPLF
jgi:predicted HTH transcriptional regulator